MAKNTPAPTGAFLFRDGRNQLYKVAFEGKRSELYTWTQFRWLHLRPVKDDAELEIFMANEGHPPEVDPIGRNFFLVKSLTRPDVSHIVDLDPNEYGQEPACSCEQNRFRKCKCRHLQAVEEYLAKA